MEEFFINKYVVETERGHPGRTSYTVYSTREDMLSMAQALTQALTTPDATRLDPRLPTDLVWHHYATIAGGETCRVTLAFCVADDLMRFHVRPTFGSRLRSWLGLACWLAFIAFAGIGICATASGYIGVSPTIQGVLFGIPLVGLAIGLLWWRDRVASLRTRRK